MIENIKDSLTVNTLNNDFCDNINDMNLKNKTKKKTKKKKLNNKDILGIINNYKKRNFDNDLFESMNSIYTLNTNSNENKDKITMLIENDQFLIPYLIYENTIPVIFNQYKNRVTKNNLKNTRKN